VTVTVTDHDHRPVTGLKTEDFTLYEDGKQQPISSVAAADVPACIGILVDSSGSMRGKHAAIASAMGEFMRAGNPGNQYFVVLFSDDAFLQEDFTHDVEAIERAIATAEARGGTGFYDAVLATADHLAQRKTCEKRVLVLVSDGVDNESRKTLEQTVRSLNEDGNPLVYAIGLPERMASLSSRGKHAFQSLTGPGGGEAISLGDFGDIRKAARRIADEIRSQYSLTYSPTATGNPQPKVSARAQGSKNLAVRINIAQEPVVRPTAVAAPPSPAGARAPSAQPALAQPLGSDCISGSVVDEDQKPVARIRVEALPAFAPNPYSGRPSPYSVTDAQGHFRLAALAKGNYRLYARPDVYARGQSLIYRNEDRTPVASSGSCANITLKFLTRFATLKIHLIDAVTREPIPDYAILLRNASGEATSMSRFDPEAGIRVPPGIELTIQAWIVRTRLRSAPMTLTTPGAGASQNITLEIDQRQPSARENQP
jgi:VWFA-related protein